jgi:hypothetical protein
MVNISAAAVPPPGVGLKMVTEAVPPAVPEAATVAVNCVALRNVVLIYVVMTAGAAMGSTGALRRRMAAEMRVMMRPTGRGSMMV